MKKLIILKKQNNNVHCPYTYKGSDYSNVPRIYINDGYCKGCYFYQGRFKNEKAIQCSFDDFSDITIDIDNNIKNKNLKMKNNFLLLEKIL